jgi:hypothetical protein
MMKMIGMASVEAVTECSQCGKSKDACCRCPCNKAFYCNPECQHRHWNVHKSECTCARRGPPPLGSCLQCGTVSSELMHCVCEQALYCSIACQQMHWGTHRRVCRDWTTWAPTTAPKANDTGAQTEPCACRKTIRELRGRGPQQTPPTPSIAPSRAGAADNGTATTPHDAPGVAETTASGKPRPRAVGFGAVGLEHDDIQVTVLPLGGGSVAATGAGAGAAGGLSHVERLALCEEEEASVRWGVGLELEGAVVLLANLYEEQYCSAARQALLREERAGRVNVVKNWTLATQRLRGQVRSAAATPTKPANDMSTIL